MPSSSVIARAPSWAQAFRPDVGVEAAATTVDDDDVTAWVGVSGAGALGVGALGAGASGEGALGTGASGTGALGAGASGAGASGVGVGVSDGTMGT